MTLQPTGPHPASSADRMLISPLAEPLAVLFHSLSYSPYYYKVSPNPIYNRHHNTASHFTRHHTPLIEQMKWGINKI